MRPSQGDKTTGEEADALRLATENARAAFIEAMDDDFNTASAIAMLFELVRALNTAREAGVTGPFYEAAQATLRELGGVLGLRFAAATAEPANEVAATPFIELLIEVRGELRALKQWAAADRIRNRLKELGILLEDTPAGTKWHFGE
ncbi:MAG TPA: hypothetical protein PKE45_10970 [Caldilineaceae bacterium]|nr:hypothetical protein [Caldilineaceae bacterium]